MFLHKIIFFLIFRQIEGVPGKKPQVTSDKFLDSPSKLFCIRIRKGEFDLTSKVTLIAPNYFVHPFQ